MLAGVYSDAKQTHYLKCAQAQTEPGLCPGKQKGRKTVNMLLDIK